MNLPMARGNEADPMRLVLSVIETMGFGLWFLAVHRSGEIAINAGPRAAKASFVADRLTDPAQFNGALAFVAALFLLSLAAFASTVWDMVVASRNESEPD